MSQQNISQAPQSMQQQHPPMPMGAPRPGYQMQGGQMPPLPTMGQQQPRADPGNVTQMFQNLMINQQQHRGDKQGQKKERPPAIYVAGLPNNYFNLELEKLFKAKGHKPIGAVVCVDHVTQKPKNYGFVSFATQADAKRAQEDMNNHQLNGKYLRISLQNNEKSFDDAANLYVRSLAPEVTQQAFYTFFQQFGKICSCKVETFQDGKSRCFGFVSFDTAQSATDTLARFESNKEQFTLGGKQFEVFLHQPKSSRRMDDGAQNKFTNLFVKNFPVGTDNNGLTAMFAEHGEIQSAQVQIDKNTQEPRDSGFVCFKNPEDAEKALNAMNKKRLENGSFLLVSQHISKRENELIHNSKQAAPIQQNLCKTFDSNLFIKNLPADLTEAAFKETFEKWGTVISVKFRTNPHVAQATYKQGFVLYENVDHAKLAIKNLDQMSPFGNRPISVDFWVSKQELENERHQKEQNEMMNWIRHAEEIRNKPEGGDQMNMGGQMGGQQYGGQGGYMQHNQRPNSNYNQNKGQFQQRGGRQGGNYRGNNNRGGPPQNGGDRRPHQPRMQGNQMPAHQANPIMSNNNFPPSQDAKFNPQQQVMPQQQPPPTIVQELAFPQVNLQELQALPDRAEKLKFVGNAIYFPIHALHGEMAGKITGCLLDGVVEIERLVQEPDFLNQNVQQVYNLLMQQQNQANAQAQHMEMMPMPTPQ